MKKIINKVILIASCILFIFLALGATMVFIPGVNILGVKYVRSTSGSVYDIKQKYAPEGSFSSVDIVADNIPIKLNFVQSYNYTVELNERFNGFSKYTETPKLTMEVVDGALKFYAQEYKPFIYHNRLDEYGLIISIPVYYLGKVSVTSQTSKITVGGLTGQLDTLSLNTKGLITIEDSFSANNLEIVSGSKWIKINENCKIANNLTIKTTNGSAEVFAPIGGEINFTSNSGKLFFNLCNSLKVTCKTGGVEPLDKSEGKVNTTADISCNGSTVIYSAQSVTAKTKNGDFSFGQSGLINNSKLDVETKSGNIKLLGEFKAEDVSLKTNSGDIAIQKIDTIKINTKHGKVKLNSVETAEVNAGSSGVEILKATNNVTVSTRSGYVKLGTSGADFNASATISTLGGDVKIISGDGKSYDITTKSGKVQITNCYDNISEYKITSKSGSISLQGINGKSDIQTSGEVSLSVHEFNGEVSVNAKNKKVEAVVEDEAIYYLQSKGKKVSVPAKNEKVEIYNTTIGATDTKNLLTVKTHKGKITISEKF
ncbi:MAG: DUF4097 family beta strand repeat-containing protein [Christensenellales bacterium]